MEERPAQRRSALWVRSCTLVFICLFFPFITHAASPFWTGLWCTTTSLFGSPCQYKGNGIARAPHSKVLSEEVSVPSPAAPVINEYQNIYPVTVVYKPAPVESSFAVQTVSRPSSTRDFVSFSLFEKQVDKLFDRLGERISDVRESVDDLEDGIAAAITTATLAITGDLTVGGNVTFTSLAGGLLQVDSNGLLSTTTMSLASIVDDSLNFDKFSDSLLLDASTDISITGSNVFSLTNTGTGNSFVVNDEAGDATPFVVDGSGNVGIGTSSPSSILSIVGSGTSVLRFESYGGSNTFRGQRAGGSVGSPTALSSGNSLTNFTGGGYDGTAFYDAARITFSTSGAWSGTNHGTIMQFSTTPNNSTTLTEVMRLAGDGSLRIGNSSYTQSGNPGANGLVIQGNVGIGTTTPNYRLSVIGSGSDILSVYRNTANESRLRIENTARAWAVGLRDSTGVFGIRDRSADVERLVINTSGNVGIGTTTPSTRLTVTASGAHGISLDQDTSSTADSARLFFRNINGSFAALASGSALQFRYGATPGSSSGTAGLIMSSTGSVGIGTTTPGTSRLYVEHSQDGQSVSQFTNLNTGTFAQQVLSVGSSGGALVLYSQGGNFATSGIFEQDASTIRSSSGVSGGLAVGTGASAPLKFFTNDTARMTITSAGNVGIGTTTPNQKLSIFNNGADAGIEFSTISGAAKKWTIGIDDSDSAKFKISSSSSLGTSDRLVINGAGNVGIGTSNPGGGVRLDVVGGNIRTGGLGGGSDYGVIFTPGDAGTYGWIANTAAGNGIQIGGGTTVGTNPYLSVITEGGLQGNVGIGTTTPTTKLHVAGTGRFDNDVHFYNTALTRIGTIDDLNTNDLRIQAVNDDMYLDAVSDIFLRTNINTDALTILASGNVGIGTTTPSYKLDMDGSGGTTIRIGGGSSSGAPTLYLDDNEAGGTGFQITNGYDGDGKLAIRDVGGNSTLVTITNTGNVGIGTTSPQKLLHLSGNAGLMRLQGTDHVYAEFYKNGSATRDAYIGFPGSSSDYFEINTQNDGTNIILQPNGNIGIGTSNPNNGKVEVKGGTVCVDTDSDNTASSCIANESDKRLKENVQSISASSSLDILLQLNPVSFDWRANDPEVLAHYPLISRFASNTHSIGLIAQEVQLLIPEAIQEETVGDEEVQYLQLDYTKLIPHLIGAVKELWTKVALLLQNDDEQYARIIELEARIQSLEEALNDPDTGGNEEEEDAEVVPEEHEAEETENEEENEPADEEVPTGTEETPEDTDTPEQSEPEPHTEEDAVE